MEGWSVPGNLISSGWDTFHVAPHRISLDWSRQPLWGGLQPLLPGCMALLVSPDSPITLFPSWGAHGHGHCHRQATCNRRPMEWVDPLSLPTRAGGSLQLLAGQACPSLTSCRIASQRWPENFLLEMISFFHGRPRNLPKGKYHGPLWTRKRWEMEINMGEVTWGTYLQLVGPPRLISPLLLLILPRPWPLPSYLPAATSRGGLSVRQT